MDPVKEFPAEVIDLVFEFLSPAELLNCTLVCQDWNDKIGSSFNCMKKYTLGLRNDWMSTKETQTTVCSRKFSNVLISEGTKMLPFVYNMMSSIINWKSVKIFCTKFYSPFQFIKHSKTFASTAENLVLLEVSICKPNNINFEIKLKNLKSLSITYCDKAITESVLSNHQKLESLKLGGVMRAEQIDIASKLKNFKNLKKLKLASEWFKLVFDETWIELNFRLEELSVANMHTVLPNKANDPRENFLKFLISQNNSLKALNLGEGFDLDVIKLAFGMKKLESLLVTNFRIPYAYEIDFPTNVSIKYFDIVWFNIRRREDLTAILKCLPNLENLRMRTIDESIAHFIAENLKHLKKIFVVHSRSKAVEAILPKIEWE